ncbi:XrtA/PEP-CTERM system TPR-repeat protein PrsT [Noviherbaspirillum sp.]|uniref:XrtA/PEP-CTERM system TPR-repeat protein PrsT n=1 Tax=Noviherbaspirillum sp. TaxID=1926288 RepID=UPI002FE2E728
MRSNCPKLLVSLTVAFIFAGGLVGCNTNEDTHSLIAEAKEYQKKGEAKAAIIQLKNVLQKQPENSEARALLGTIYLDTGDFASAEKEVRKALSLGADPGSLLPALGKALFYQGQYQKVLDEVQLQAGVKPDAHYFTVRGHAYLALGKSQEAQNAYNQALAQTPDFADALIGLAKHSLIHRNLANAEKFVDQTTGKHPAFVDAWLFKGDLLRVKGETNDALAAYAKAIALKPDHVAAYIARSHLLINAEKFDEAKAELDSARKYDAKSLLVTYTQSLLDFKQGKHAVALESVLQVLRESPNHMPSVLLAGLVQFALGSTQQAEQHFKRYLETMPGDPYASRLLVAVLLKNGEADRAIKTLAPLLKSGEKDAQLLTLAGEAYMRVKDFSKATEYFEQASALAPETAGIRTALGMSRLAKGENARGIAELEAAANMDSQPTQAGVLLVMAHMRLKEYDKALSAIAKLEKSQPENPLLPNLKGGIYLSKKDVAAARNSFQSALKLQPNYFPAVSNLAQLEIQEKKPDLAKKRLETFLESNNKNMQAQLALAGIALSQGSNSEATRLLEKTVADHPDELKPATLLIAQYLRVGEKQKSLVLAQKLQASNPESPDVLDLLAQAHLSNNDPAAALQSYKKLLAMAPKSPVAHFKTAAVHMAMNNQSAADQALKTAVSLKPDFLDAHLALATLAERNGNHDQALRIAKQIQKQPQSSSVGYVLEGDVFMAQKKPELAAKAYEQALANNQNGFALIKLHEALALSGKEKAGEARLVQWIKQRPNDVPVRMFLATKHLTRNQNKEAMEHFQAVLEADPNNAAALNNMALAYQHEKDPRALQFAEKAYTNAPDNPAILDTLGWLLVEQGSASRGLPLLQKAVSLAPKQPDIRYHLVHGLLKSGDKVKARQELETLLASGADFAKADEAKTLLKQIQ